jgi:arylsulfatase A-like enzyme
MPDGKPNVLIILADDIGWYDVGCYNQGVMDASTPNIDWIAAEGVRLTDCYAQASCTAGWAALITGQLPMRTGLTTVGMPVAPQGIQPEDPTLAELLKPLGYATAEQLVPTQRDDEIHPSAPTFLRARGLVRAGVVTVGRN